MLFSSALFLFRFLPIAVILYYLTPSRLKNLTLLLCSLVFYGWGEVKYLWIIAVVILINYFCGIMISRSGKPVARRFFLILSAAGSLLMLLWFKYAGFFATTLNQITGQGTAAVRTVALPLGISFYTFQSMSYSIDVYRQKVSCEKNIINFSAYIAMFPQLIAGPIVRYPDVSERLHKLKNRISPEQVEEGVSLFIFGLAKKVLLADSVNMLWTDIVGRYSEGRLVSAGVGLENASTPLAWLGIVAYALYIYNDFSGYSLMGIGLGKILGFDFPDNFNLPYISRSITEFWRRWHMTLSSWFREYVYIPLGGNRKGLPRQILNLLIVWLLTGFWHGAGWNFILWGLYYFVFLTMEKLFLLKPLESGRIWPRVYTLFIVFTGWAVFVSGDPGVGLGLLMNKLFVPQSGVSWVYFARNYSLILIIAAFFSCSIPMKIYDRLKKNTYVRVAILLLMFTACAAYIVSGGYKPFLYFNF